MSKIIFSFIELILNLIFKNRKFNFSASPEIQESYQNNPEYLMKELFYSYGGRWKLVNILGLRNSSDPGKWNDLIIVFVQGKIRSYISTVDPSKYFTLNPLVSEGCANLPYGYYENLWHYGIHKGYMAFVHHGKKIRVWRDKNQNFKEDDSESYFYKTAGCNFHHGHSTRGDVGVHSALCQVIRDKKEFFDLYDKSKETGQTDFDYLLLPFDHCPEILVNLKKGIWHYTNN